MANANTPFGLRPINQNGTPWSGQGMMVNFLVGNGNNIFIGDAVVATGATDAFGVPVVQGATMGAGNTILGAFMGICNGPAGSGFTVTRDLPVYRQASVANYGWVVDDPDQLYVVQEDSSGGAIAAATSAFANGNLTAGAGGSTVTGYSSQQLQSSSVSSSANTNYQLRLIGLLRGPDNVIGNQAKWVVKLNNPQFASTTGV